MPAVLTIWIGVHSPAVAKYREDCTVKYATEYGWSTGYEVHCTYITGTELNAATSTFNYEAFATYAVVFWAQGEASVIRMQGFFFCAGEATDGCASTTYLPVSGTDQRGRSWMVCSANQYTC